MGVDQTDEVLDVVGRYQTDLHLGVSAAEPSIRLADYRKHEYATHVVYALDMAPDAAQQLIAEASALQNTIAHTTPSWSPGRVDVHITHEAATKEHGIQQLIALHGLQPAEVIGVGDGANDIPIFKAVGHRVAMANGEASLKELADEIAPSVEEDGLAHIIEKYFLS
jgi:HAD superfamily hydrolase (TIGR01484 family)